MTQLKRFFNNFAAVLMDTRKTYNERHLDHLLGS
jgi:hypothetical protein